MSAQSNKILINEYVQTWNRGEIDRLSNFWAPDMVHHTRAQSQTVADVRNVISDFRAAFPEIQWEIDDIIS